MSEQKRKWDLLSEERKRACIREVITYFETECEEHIGIIVAENFLDFFLRVIWEDIYKKGVNDARTILTKWLEGLEVDMGLLLDK